MNTTRLLVLFGCLLLLTVAWWYWFTEINPSVNQNDLAADQAAFAQVPVEFGRVTEFFGDIAKTKGAVYAYELMRSVQIPPNVDVHLLGHTVGDQLYKQEGLEGMKYCTDDFRNACSHSIVIGALLENGLEVFDEVNDVCKLAPGGHGAYTMCFHGFGHGVLAYTEYDMGEAAELCMRTGTEAYNNQEGHECIGGAVMEMKDGIHDKEIWEPQKVKFVDPDNPLSLCQASYIPEGAKERCYSYITPFLFEATGDKNIPPDPSTYRAAMSFCEADTNPEYQNYCYAGFGKEFIVFANDLNVQTMESISDERLETVFEWCKAAPNQAGTRACQIEVVNSLFWGGENDYQLSLRYCSLWPAAEQSACYEHLFGIFDYYHRNNEALREEFCSVVPVTHVDQCRSVLRLD